jgi:8-oxo-dGTP pyrophosphatase MutT (NUDIX family)
MEGMTSTELERVEHQDIAKGTKLRPRDAATLILLDGQAGQFNVLMGRRHQKHVFMAGRFVFPGGRTDPSDSRISVAAPLHPAEQQKLLTPRMSESRARAIALSAIRETYEEAGLLIGHKGPFATRSPNWEGFTRNGVQPALDGLRYIGRAITPPGRTRRFDTRFFAIWREAVTVEMPEGAPTDELEELDWLPLAQAKELEIPSITRTILMELEKRLGDDPELTPGGGAVPFYFMRGNRFQRELI